MANLTARVQVSLPADVKKRLRDRSRERGVSLSTVMREIVDNIVAEHDLLVTMAQIEQSDAPIR